MLKKKTDYKAKITEIENKISTVTGLVTSAVLNAVENKIRNFSDLAKKTDYDAKISDITVKYFITFDYNKFTGEILGEKMKERIS